MQHHFGMGVLLYICCIFSEHFFQRTPLEERFWNLLQNLSDKGVFLGTTEDSSGLFYDSLWLLSLHVFQSNYFEIKRTCKNKVWDCFMLALSTVYENRRVFLKTFFWRNWWAQNLIFKIVMYIPVHRSI